MAHTVQSSYTQEQIATWLRGLLTIAWADGHFDEEEKDLIHTILDDELAKDINFETFEPVTATSLAEHIGQDSHMAENFLRTAVMVALADGVYSASEDEKLQSFCEALSQEIEVLNSLRSTLYDLSGSEPTAAAPAIAPGSHDGKIDPLKPAREWLDQLDVQDPRLARFICKLVPPQCPFERDVKLFGKKIVHIPPMCKLNPLYEQLVGLRFRALSYLADDCNEDVTPYI
ncbi:MAG: Mo-dependent nitrogenase C-terminal domain-containing protein [Thainema sp.]